MVGKKIKEANFSLWTEKIANEVCCIEYFPYHTKKFKPLKQILKSQKYGFELVKDAISRNALIIIMRAKNVWLKAVPELKNYHYYALNSFLNVTISRKNLPGGFERIIEALNPCTMTNPKNTISQDQDLEELFFADKSINKKVAKIAKLLKRSKPCQYSEKA